MEHQLGTTRRGRGRDRLSVARGKALKDHIHDNVTCDKKLQILSASAIACKTFTHTGATTFSSAFASKRFHCFKNQTRSALHTQGRLLDLSASRNVKLLHQRLAQYLCSCQVEMSSAAFRVGSPTFDPAREQSSIVISPC